MNGPHLPTFPEFVWDEFFWVSSARLPSWTGYQVCGDAYGAVSDDGASDGTVKLLFAPEGRGEGPLTEDEIHMIQWVVEHQGAVNDALLGELFKSYPGIKEDALVRNGN